METEIEEFKVGKRYTKEQMEGAGLVLEGFEKVDGESIERYTRGKENPMVYVFKSIDGLFELIKKERAQFGVVLF